MLSYKQFVNALNEVEMIDLPRRHKFGHSYDLGGRAPLYNEKKIGETPTHTLHSASSGKGSVTYIAREKKTGRAHVMVDGTEKNNVLHIHTVAAHGKSTMKAHDFYHHLLKHGKTLVSDSMQSHGGAHVWRKLAAKHGVNVHGWHRGKPVNVYPHKDPEMTHIDPYEEDPDDHHKDVRDLKLVAHLKK